MTEENTPQTSTTTEPTTNEPTVETPAEPTAEVINVATVVPAIDTTYPNVKPGSTVRVHQKIKETNTKGEEKERIQIYEGIVLARRHGVGPAATITVRKVSDGIGVEKIFPLHSPNVVKIDVIKQAVVHRAKLYFLRRWKKKLKEVKIS